MNRWMQTLVLGVVATSCVICDQISKVYFKSRLQQLEFAESYFYDTIRLVYAENRGAFLGLLGNLPPVAFVAIGSVLVLGLLAYLYSQRQQDLVSTVMIALLIGGAIGNLIDRAQYGIVRDFANLGLGPVRTGIFNVADVAITGAVIVLFARGLFQKQPAVVSSSP